MDRRSFLTRAPVVGLAGTAGLAAPAVAQGAPAITWRLTSSFAETQDIPYGGAVVMADYVRAVTGGAFDIQVAPAGEIAPALQAADAVASGTAEMCHTASSYAWGKDPAWAFGTCVPFGLNARMTNAWFYHGGGIDLMNGFYAQQGLFALPCGNTGAQMGGWYRRELADVSDLKGLKIRIAGLGGRVLEKLGALPQQLSADETYAGLQDGSLDAAEWVGPYDDEKLELYKVAPYYYYPGWWEGGAALQLMVNLDAWTGLPAAYQAAVTAAAQAANCDMIARYDAQNPAAIKRLVAAGAQLRPFAPELLSACFEAAMEVYDEIAAGNETFAALRNSQDAFKRDAYLWTQLSELNFDSYMMAQDNAGKL